MMTLLGVLLFVVGLAFSIWFHELGHFVWARRFGMRVTQFMVGFGPTLWSRRIGETEHGVKAIPLGGYIRIVGMMPPGDEDLAGRKLGRLRKLVEEVRGASLLDIGPGDGDRVFYRKPWWQRIIVMSAGPAHNLVFAFVLFTIILVGFGIPTPTTTVDSVSQCVLPATAPRDAGCNVPVDETGAPCEAGPDCAIPVRSPASEAGFQPADRIVAIDGRPLDSWDGVRGVIRGSPDEPITVTVLRDGDEVDLTVTPLPNRVYADGTGESDETVTVGFLGLGPTTPYVQQPITSVPGQVGEFIAEAAQRLIGIPAKMPQLFRAAFLGEERDVNGPVGIVGVGRISGEVFGLPAEDAPFQEKMIFFLGLLASLNMVLFLFNLVPLYPLDGGHVAGALWEKARAVVARLRHKPDPGPFDTARLMPVAYVVASVFIVLSGLLLVADIVNPITLDSLQ
ncbi:MAG: site-2 protease family protein [Geodermatophilaceae bacterium]|nr:site-2 protease family protein [Geodermatophilaceae bacterium]